MIYGIATSLFSPATTGLLMAAAALPPGEVSTTLYLTDTHFEHLGPRAFTRNPLIKQRFPIADRNVIATQTAAVFVDTLIHQAEEGHHGENLSLHILGDVPDTPCRAELERFERILERHPVPVEGHDRGNHSSACAFGVINFKSRLYEFLRRYVPLIRRFSLKQEICKACGESTQILSAQDTLQGMHRILHKHRSETPGVDHINVRVQEADCNGYRLEGSHERIPFNEAHQERVFRTFWRPSPATRRMESSEKPYWEAMVNYQVADMDVADRPTKVNPFYIQASETARFDLGKSQEVPVYSISLDAMDNTNFWTMRPGISALQVRLVEAFIDRKLRENPLARFKLSCHFLSHELLNRSVPRRVRKAFKRLLAREEVILFTSGHTHKREVVDLNRKLRLKRRTPLTEVVAPSLIDYHPAEVSDGTTDDDARAVVVERMWVEADPEGRAQLKLDLRYKGLDRVILQPGMTEGVRRELETYEQEHGYLRSRETIKDWRSKHILGWTRSQLKRAWEFFSIGFNVFRPRRMRQYWRDLSIVQYLIDNLTVASTINMFNEAYHLIPFLDTITHFIGRDGDPEERAVQAQIDGIRTALSEDYRERKHQFERALADGERAGDLRQYNDLFQRSGAYLLPHLLLELKMEGQARAFAVLAGLAASRAEYGYSGRHPSRVPNQLPLSTIPLGVTLALETDEAPPSPG